MLHAAHKHIRKSYFFSLLRSDSQNFYSIISGITFGHNASMEGKNLEANRHKDANIYKHKFVTSDNG